MATYGPYYTSQLMAIKGQKKALTGQEAFSPWEMESIVRGELGSRYAAAESRQTAQRNYDLALAANQRAETELGMQAQAIRHQERAAKMAGQAEAMKWGYFGAEGILGEGTTISGGKVGETTQSAQGQATGRATGTQVTTGLERGFQVVGGTIGSLLGGQTGPVGAFAGGVAGKLLGDVTYHVAQSAYNSLTGIGDIFGPSVAGATAATGAFPSMSTNIAGNVNYNLETGEMIVEPSWGTDVSTGVGGGK